MMRGIRGQHVFSATRKGTPKGEAGTWVHSCDRCGRGPDAAIHQGVPQAEHDAEILRLIKAED